MVTMKFGERVPFAR